ncbi:MULTISPECIES: LysR family transcriptional regulator [unclassified Clostridium]|uniref:LysR family transcriptional regulator n=1 Tax=unclassified Clostridium TaxID=2614128 RepID=UPI00290A4D76|nr:LysR family transcriptional regulator [Clostridium sp.]MDU5106577.1 LysR family transcriptional regulator [Clostridium sp.]
MHIDSLNYFFQVANSNSISTVAKNAHISQSALSQQISKLENNLNVQLFNRTNKGVSLTSEGEILFKYAESILSSYNKMQEELLNSVNKKKYVSIEAVESIGLTLLPMAISKLKKNFSSYTINLNTIDCCSKANLSSNLCDIFICYTKPENANGLTTKLIGYDEILLVAGKNFQVPSIKKDDLFDLPLILSSDKTCLKTLICNEFNYDNKILDSSNILYSTNSYFSALKGVSSSKAATFIPASIYNNYHSIPDIKIINIHDLSIKLPIYISYFDSFYKINSEFVKSLKSILKGYLN